LQKSERKRWSTQEKEDTNQRLARQAEVIKKFGDRILQDGYQEAHDKRHQMRPGNRRLLPLELALSSQP
jgi:hypothetical protein